MLKTAKAEQLINTLKETTTKSHAIALKQTLTTKDI